MGDKSDAAPHRIVHARCGETGSSQLISVSSAAVAAAAELGTEVEKETWAEMEAAKVVVVVAAA